jgi:hypothetical protein
MDYKARFYSPALGRFVSPDDVIPDVSNPQAWNRYSYVNNRPIIFNDPTGHAPSCDNGDWDGCKSKTVIFFGGSYTTDINNPGPSPFVQSPLWTTDQAGRPVNLVPYPGSQKGAEKDDGRPSTVPGKTQQAINAQGLLVNESVDIIAYSAGTEASLMYAQWRLENGQGVNSVVLLGPTFVTSSMTFDEPNGGWSGVMDDLIEQGVNIYVLDDSRREDEDSRDYLPPTCSSCGVYHRQRDKLDHYSYFDWFEGTNNSQRIKNTVYSWLVKPE